MEAVPRLCSGTVSIPGVHGDYYLRVRAGSFGKERHFELSRYTLLVDWRMLSAGMKDTSA